MGNAMNPESIASKLLYFQEQLHLLHWKTMSYAEHMALGGLYEYIQTFRDDLIEKLMGYTNTRVSSVTIKALNSDVSSIVVVNELLNYASNLKKYGEQNSYHDVCNLADALSGEAAKVKYLLTLT